MKPFFVPLLFILSVSTVGLVVADDPVPSMDDLVAGEVSLVADGFRFIEGPVWHKDGYLLFSDIPANTIYKQEGETTTVWRDESGKSNGLTFDKEGNFYAAEHWNRRISRTNTDGTIETLIAKYDGKQFNSPNDLIVRSDGTIFFTDPDWGLEGREREIPFNGVYRLPPGGEPVLLANDFVKPNGIALSPDEKTLYVCDDTASHVRAFDLDEEGNVSNGRVLNPVPKPDGLKVDVQGNLYVTSSDGIVILAPDGTRIGAIEVPQQPANCAFGGEDNKTLFMTSRSGLYSVQLKVPGLPVW